MEKVRKDKTSWKVFYWSMVVVIFFALIFLVRFVLNSSKIMVDESMLIHPYKIEWGLERDQTLRINEPFFLDTDLPLIQEDLDKIKSDSAIYSLLILNPEHGGTLRDLKYPYLIWKNEHSDTIHILKNNIVLNFSLKNP